MKLENLQYTEGSRFVRELVVAKVLVMVKLLVKVTRVKMQDLVVELH